MSGMNPGRIVDEARFNELTRAFFVTRHVPTLDEQYPCRIYVCRKCNENRSQTVTMQTRSTDEGETLMVFYACGCSERFTG